MLERDTNLEELSARYTKARQDQPFTPRAANLFRDALLYIKGLELKIEEFEKGSEETE